LVTREYELMYIVRPDVDDEALAAAVKSVRTLIEGTEGAVLKTTMWGKRRLAFEVKHLRDGHYVIVRANLDPTRVREIERALTIHDAVFRHLLTVAPDITDPSQIETDDPVIVAKAEVEDDIFSSSEDDEDDDEREFAAVGAEVEEEAN
jgi:small subunit ribosomal protein S6